MTKLKQFIENEDFSKFLAQLFKSKDVRPFLTNEKYNIKVEIREVKEPADPTFGVLQSIDRPKLETTFRSRLERCHSFLLEELEPRCLLMDQAVAEIFGSCFDKFNQPGLRTIEAETFLEYLKNQSEEKIKFVLEKLKEKNQYIYDQLFPDTSKYQDIEIEQVKGNILDTLPELLDIVSIPSFQTPLLSAGVITPEALDFIHKSSKSCRIETLQFVKLILHRGPEAIKLFLSALENSCGESISKNLLRPRNVETMSAQRRGHPKINYRVFNEESGLLFEGKFVLELVRQAGRKEEDKNIFKKDKEPTVGANLETLPEDDLSETICSLQLSKESTKDDETTTEKRASPWSSYSFMHIYMFVFLAIFFLFLGVILSYMLKLESNSGSFKSNV
ncbi:uncharacterized protein LOC134266401 [Saccostrea cucullata]